jgi:hypothetical protein
MLSLRLLLIAASLALVLAGGTAYIANVVENPAANVSGPSTNYGPIAP